MLKPCSTHACPPAQAQVDALTKEAGALRVELEVARASGGGGCGGGGSGSGGGGGGGGSGAGSAELEAAVEEKMRELAEATERCGHVPAPPPCPSAHMRGLKAPHAS